jgi:ribonuclease-3 family protein
MEAKNRNSLALAYIGDAIYEVYIREYLLEQGLEKVNKLQREATKYVSARGQASYLKMMIDDNFLTEEELSIVMRARNHKTNSSPKNTDIVTYKNATGLEALVGCLYLEKKYDRIAEIMDYIKER